MLLTFEKLKGHITFGVSRPSVLKFHICILHPKIIDAYFCKSGLSSFVELCLF